MRLEFSVIEDWFVIFSIVSCGMAITDRVGNKIEDAQCSNIWSILTPNVGYLTNSTPGIYLLGPLYL